MILSRRRTKAKFEELKEEQRWFAWHPVRTVHGESVWLQYVVKRLDRYLSLRIHLKFGSVAEWEYRLYGTFWQY